MLLELLWYEGKLTKGLKKGRANFTGGERGVTYFPMIAGGTSFVTHHYESWRCFHFPETPKGTVLSLMSKKTEGRLKS